MGRWRPPQPDSSAYITAEGYTALQDEQKTLWKKRAVIVKALAAAAAEGDRSENAEYIYRKKELAGIDRRIRYLQRRLPKLIVVHEFTRRDKIFFGAWVALEHEDGTSIEYRIVGPDETAAENNWISMDSPLAKALQKKERNDEIRVEIHDQIITYLVTGIRYADDSANQPS